MNIRALFLIVFLCPIINAHRPTITLLEQPQPFVMLNQPGYEYKDQKLNDSQIIEALKALAMQLVVSAVVDTFRGIICDKASMQISRDLDANQTHQRIAAALKSKLSLNDDEYNRVKDCAVRVGLEWMSRTLLRATQKGTFDSEGAKHAAIETLKYSVPQYVIPFACEQTLIKKHERVVHYTWKVGTWYPQIKSGVVMARSIPEIIEMEHVRRRQQSSGS